MSMTTGSACGAAESAKAAVPSGLSAITAFPAAPHAERGVTEAI